jgi:hypothetical protein
VGPEKLTSYFLRRFIVARFRGPSRDRILNLTT